jgi:hypothetical protein
MHRFTRLTLASLAWGSLALMAWSSCAQAQAVAPGINAGRDCQTVRRCNFTKTGTFRGCISAYSCRTCRTEPANCTFSAGSSRKNCTTFTCSWGS